MERMERVGRERGESRERTGRELKERREGRERVGREWGERGDKVQERIRTARVKAIERVTMDSHPIL
jgi:hypothetical protein